MSSHAITDVALAELGRRTAMLDAISYAATQIVGGADWRAGIQELLDRLGRATEVSRVTLFEVHRNSDGHAVESCRYDWADAGYARLSPDPRYQNIPLDEAEGQLSAWGAARQRGEIVQATLRDVTGETRKTFLEHGTQAFVSVPIMLRSGAWGFLGLDDCRNERQWSDLEVDVLKTAAALIAGAIERAQADEELRRSRERYVLAARGANDGLWDWDLVENRSYLSPRLYEILDRPEGSLADPQNMIAACCHPADAEDWRRYLGRRHGRWRRWWVHRRWWHRHHIGWHRWAADGSLERLCRPGRDRWRGHGHVTVRRVRWCRRRRHQQHPDSRSGRCVIAPGRWRRRGGWLS